MDRELEELLARAREINPTPAELNKQRIRVAAANGHLSDERITIRTMVAVNTIITAGAKPEKQNI